MPLFDIHARRYNTLRLLGYDYSSVKRFCAITLVAHLRRPLFADVILAKMILGCLLSDEVLHYIGLRGFTLMPEHLHMVVGVRNVGANVSMFIGRLKSFTTQLYWKRSKEIIESNDVTLPSAAVTKSSIEATRLVTASLMEWRATLRPEVVQLSNWPLVKPAHFLNKHLWQSRFFDHIIRNRRDLEDNLDYLAMNPVHAGYVTHPQFYPYTGFLKEC